MKQDAHQQLVLMRASQAIDQQYKKVEKALRQ
jgi:hypothetical protein